VGNGASCLKPSVAAAARLIFDACRNNPLEPQVGSTEPNRAIDRSPGRVSYPLLT
jgi:hypothetical protein